MTLAPNLVFPGLLNIEPPPSPETPRAPQRLKGEVRRTREAERKARWDVARFANWRAQFARPALGCFAVTDLDDTTCKFAVTDQPQEHRFCGAPPKPNKCGWPYCDEHLLTVTEPPRPSRRGPVVLRDLSARTG